MEEMSNGHNRWRTSPVRSGAGGTHSPYPLFTKRLGCRSATLINELCGAYRGRCFVAPWPPTPGSELNVRAFHRADLSDVNPRSFAQRGFVALRGPQGSALRNG